MPAYAVRATDKLLSLGTREDGQEVGNLQVALCRVTALEWDAGGTQATPWVELTTDAASWNFPCESADDARALYEDLLAAWTKA